MTIINISRICHQIMNNPDRTEKAWLDYLSDEDTAFVKRFLLCSGSLKDLAGTYGISYPTVRLRLDRLIAKIQVVDDHQEISQFEKLLRAQYAEGSISPNTFERLLAAYREELEKNHET
jgi:hypothetical protein